jgi:enoyl-CoA hydratase
MRFHGRERGPHLCPGGGKYMYTESESPCECIKIEREKDLPLLWITINRPQVLNALNAKVLEELRAALMMAEKDEKIKVILITGAGEKAFVAGADIKELESVGPLEAGDFCHRGQDLFNAIEKLEKPVIAVINGFALGGGCELALACDVRIASAKAIVGQPEINLGLIPGYGGTQRLARLAGKGKALELILTGDMIDALEAEKIGIINRVVAPEKLKEEAVALAKKMAEKSLKTMGLVKRAIHDGLEMGLSQGCAYEASLFAQACATADKKEGIRAFLDKRKPQFTDK